MEQGPKTAKTQIRKLRAKGSLVFMDGADSYSRLFILRGGAIIKLIRFVRWLYEPFIAGKKACN